MQSDGETRRGHHVEDKPTVFVQMLESGKQSRLLGTGSISPGRIEENSQRSIRYRTS